MDRDDAAKDVVAFDLSESRVLHHAGDGVLIRMAVDGVHQIAIRCRIAHHQATEDRPGAAIGIPQARQEPRRTGPGLGELQHHRHPAAAQHAVHLAQARILVREVAQAEGDRDGIEGAPLKRESGAVGLHAIDVGAALVEHPVAPHGEHRGIDVGQYDAARAAHRESQERCHIAAAAGQVQRSLTAPQPRQLHQRTLEQAMGAERHEIVHHVVALRHRVEHLGAATLLLRAGRRLA